MIPLRQIFAALLVPFALASCGAFEHYDSRYPTVSQQDAYDVSWGLTPRKSRGNPKLRYQYDARREQAQMSAPAAPAAPAPATPAPIPTTVPSSPTPTVQRAIPSNLR